MGIVPEEVLSDLLSSRGQPFKVHVYSMKTNFHSKILQWTINRFLFYISDT